MSQAEYARVGAAVAELVDIMARLRAEDGCPWDREQTHESLKEYLAEESAELFDAIDSGRPDDVREELGDVLLQVVFHCQIASEKKRFDLDDVARGICDKLIRQHPHVFGQGAVADADGVVRQWETIKRGEKEKDDERNKSALGGVPRSLPALHRAHKMQVKAARVGFDWPSIDGVIAKIEEELAEVHEAISNGDDTRVAEEIGDLLFAVVNLSRYRRHLAEDLLHSTVAKFEKRFHFIEDKLEQQGMKPENCTLEQLDSLWNEAKKGEVH